MTISILRVQCPECQRDYNIYPAADELGRLLAERQVTMECDFCEKVLAFRVLNVQKPLVSVGGN
jgi:phage FluMu protein Com